MLELFTKLKLTMDLIVLAARAKDDANTRTIHIHG